MRSRILPVLLLILLPPIFFWRETLGRLTLGDQDAVFWFFPAYRFFHDQILSGQAPLWTPYLYSGTPLYAQWQAGMLDPINLIYLFGATSRTLTLSLEISFALSLLSAFCYGRVLGFTRRSSVVTAVIYSLSGFAVGRTLYPGFLHIIALTPLVLFFVEKIYREGRWRDVVFGALVIAWQVFAAHPQPLIYSSLLAVAYALFRNDLRSQISNFKSTLRFLTQFAIMFIAGAGLSAVQLIPAWEIAKDSVRREWPFELFTLHSLHPISLATALFPFFHGSGKTIYQMPYWGVYWHHNEAQIYLGLIAIALAFAGGLLAAKERHRIGIFWSAAATIGVILSLGKYSGPIAQALYYVPLISHFRSPNRHWMEVTLAVAALAGYAIDRLLRDDSKLIGRYIKISAIALTLLTCAIGGFILLRKEAAERAIRSLPDLSGQPPGFLQAGGAEFYIPMVTSIVACLSLLFFVNSKRRSRRFVVVLAVLLIDYNLYAAFAPINNPFKLETLIGGAMPQSLAEKSGPIRYHVMLNAATGEFSPFWFYGREMATGYDPMLNDRYKTFSGIDEAGRTYLSSLLDPQDRTLDLLNVGYVFVSPVFFDQPQSQSFAPIELSGNGRAVFSAKDAGGDTLVIVSALANSIEIPDGAEVAEVEVKCESGVRWAASLRAGRDASEWAYDRPDVKRAIRHARAPIAESAPPDAGSTFQAHSYVSRFKLPADLTACRGAKAVQFTAKTSGNVSISIKRATLEDAASGKALQLARSGNAALNDTTRWREIAERSPAKPYQEYRIFENRNVLPRAWIVNRARVAYEGDQLKLIRGEITSQGERDFDPQSAALVDHETAAKLDPGLLNGNPVASGTARIIDRDAKRMTLETENASLSILVLSEIASPGWRVRIDGQPADFIRVNYNLRGIALPAGKHKIELRYLPDSIKTGASVSLITLVALFIAWLRGKQKRERS